jgi:hypothetical protein
MSEDVDPETTQPDTAEELLARLLKEYPDRHALDSQPDWITDLNDAHSSIQLAYVRKRGPSPEPKVELRVKNSVSGTEGWHRIEAIEEGWFYPYTDPPAGVATALQWLRENVHVTEFRTWFDHNG